MMFCKLPTDEAVVGIGGLRRVLAGSADQYRVTAYDTDESFQRRVVVVSDLVTEPTWVRHPQRRTKALCLMVPSLDALTVEHLTRITNCVASFFGVRDLFTGTPVRTIQRQEKAA